MKLKKWNCEFLKLKQQIPEVKILNSWIYLVEIKNS